MYGVNIMLSQLGIRRTSDDLLKLIDGKVIELPMELLDPNRILIADYS